MDFINGYLIGLGTIIFIGPVFFLLLSTTFEFGVKSGLLIALGIIVSDIVYAVVCYFGFINVLKISNNNVWLAVIGSVILILLGINYVFKKSENGEPIVYKQKNYLSLFVKGFLVNFVNPFVLLVWIGFVNYSMKFTNGGIFIVGILFGILTTDVLKVFASKRIKQFLSPTKLKMVYRIIGVVLILFGLRMIFSFLF